MKILLKKHSLPVRIFHWINFPVLFIMIWSGTLIYWAYDEYKITVGNQVLFQFYPESVYKALNIPYRLAEGMSWHFVFMWLFLLNGLAYFLYIIFSGEWKEMIPRRNSFRDAWFVLLHDLHIRKEKPSHGKYNAAQKFAYSMIVIMAAGSILSGFVLYKPNQFPTLTSLMGGYENARLIHFILTIGFVLFFVVHIVQVTLAGWNNFRAIVTGWEVTDESQSKNDHGK